MPGLFVTATGTEVGKTFVTAGLLRAGRRAGRTMDALKPVLTGFDETDASMSDAGVLLEALERPITPEAVAAMSPWRFVAPLAPNMAAAAESRTIDFDAVVEACRAKLRRSQTTLIEGIGGVMVPFDASRTVLDLIAALKCPAVLVSGTALGALSYGLTAYAVMASRGVAPRVVVLNESEGSTVAIEATRATFADFCPGVVIEMLGRQASEAAFDTLLAKVLSGSDWLDPSPRRGTAA